MADITLGELRDYWRDNKNAVEAVDTKMGTLLNSQDADNNLSVKQSGSIVSEKEQLNITVTAGSSANAFTMETKGSKAIIMVDLVEDEDFHEFTVKDRFSSFQRGTGATYEFDKMHNVIAYRGNTFIANYLIDINNYQIQPRIENNDTTDHNYNCKVINLV